MRLFPRVRIIHNSFNDQYTVQYRQWWTWHDDLRYMYWIKEKGGPSSIRPLDQETAYNCALARAKQLISNEVVWKA